jgi:hypothetical protein
LQDCGIADTLSVGRSGGRSSPYIAGRRIQEIMAAGRTSTLILGILSARAAWTIVSMLISSDVKIDHFSIVFAFNPSQGM